MKTKGILSIVVAVMMGVACAHSNSIAKFDPRMAVQSAVVDARGVKWIDGKLLPLEGKYFSGTSAYYDRLPSNVTDRVNGGVRGMKNHTSGMQFRFSTNSRNLHFKWIPVRGNLAMHHMPSTGVSGIDVYAQDKSGRWMYALKRLL